eukprot:EC797059.1.p1 GENE.EC797059.1~~EC797059.1.p1  ORF type:complete len:158 (+),score=52.84 EC797059.1:41-475(+)
MAAAAAGGKTAAPLREISRLEVAEHWKDDDCWLIIEGKVFNVTKFLADHPGGGELPVEGGRWRCHRGLPHVAHSSNARTQMESFLVGTAKSETEEEKQQRLKMVAERRKKVAANRPGAGSPVWLKLLVPLLIVVFALLTRFMGK